MYLKDPRLNLHLKNKKLLMLFIALALSLSIALGCGGEKVSKEPPRVRVPSKPTVSLPVVPTTPEAQREITIVSEPFAYEREGRRDPFTSLVEAKGMAMKSKAEIASLEITDFKLVGFLQSRRNALALVEDAEGHGYILKVGDRIANGRVKEIGLEGLVIEEKRDEVVRETVLKLRKEGE